MSQLPRELALSIERILDAGEMREGDATDTFTEGFDPVELLNQYFPDEESLAQVSHVESSLAETQRELQLEITELQAQLKESQDPARMQLIQEMISDLLSQMSLIREKATESEAVVRNITKDIQALDVAKKNLILSMTTLKRLQMLVSSLTQLEVYVKDKNYAEIAQSLGAVKQLSASFKSYTSVPRISQIWKRIQAIQGELRTLIDTDFDAYYVQDPAKPIKSSTITAACGVVDVLGSDIRAHFIERYVGLELKDYRRIFRVADANEAGALDNISRRFAWFRRLMQTYDVEAGRVFPKEWRVEWWLFAKFLEITRDDMATLLSKAKANLTVKVLLDTLTETMEFENSVASKFGLPFAEILKAASTPVRTAKSISSAFEPHMGIYIDAQDKALADMLLAHRGVKSRTSLEQVAASSDEEAAVAPLVVLPSSTELFYFYAQSLESCAKLAAGSDRILLDLAKVHGKWLKIYAEDVLINSLKKPTPVGQPRRSMDTRLDVSELKNACLILNTADYCQRTTEELEGKISEKVSDAAKSSISFQAERDLFVGIISAAILVQLRELENSMDVAISALGRSSWATLKQVSGPSAYVPDLEYALENFADLIKPLVEQKKYLRNFFDKASTLVLAHFTNAIVRSRPLREIGAEQLLIDLQSVKSCLLGLPGEELASSSYTRNVTKNITNLDALLKVIVIPVDTPEDFVLNYTLQIGDVSYTNFQKVLDLKGVSKANEAALLDTFLTVTSTRGDLPTTSFLSSLDMHPPSASLLSGTSTPVMSGPGSGANTLGAFGVLGSPPTREVGLAIRAALGSPPLSGSNTPDGHGEGQKREVFSDLKRFVSFGLRRDGAQGS